MVVCEIDTKKIGSGDSAAGKITLPKNFVPESILPFIGGTASAVPQPAKVSVSDTEYNVTIAAQAPSEEFEGVVAVESSGSFTYYMWDATANSNAGGASSVTATVTKYGDWVIEPTLSGAIGIVKIRILGHY